MARNVGSSSKIIEFVKFQISLLNYVVLNPQSKTDSQRICGLVSYFAIEDSDIDNTDNDRIEFFALIPKFVTWQCKYGLIIVRWCDYLELIKGKSSYLRTCQLSSIIRWEESGPLLRKRCLLVIHFFDCKSFLS